MHHDFLIGAQFPTIIIKKMYDFHKILSLVMLRHERDVILLLSLTYSFIMVSTMRHVDHLWNEGHVMQSRRTVYMLYKMASLSTKQQSCKISWLKPESLEATCSSHFISIILSQ